MNDDESRRELDLGEALRHVEQQSPAPAWGPDIDLAVAGGRRRRRRRRLARGVALGLGAIMALAGAQGLVTSPATTVTVSVPGPSETPPVTVAPSPSPARAPGDWCAPFGTWPVPDTLADPLRAALAASLTEEGLPVERQVVDVSRSVSQSAPNSTSSGAARCTGTYTLGVLAAPGSHVYVNIAPAADLEPSCERGCSVSTVGGVEVTTIAAAPAVVTVLLPAAGVTAGDWAVAVSVGGEGPPGTDVLRRIALDVPWRDLAAVVEPAFVSRPACEVPTPAALPSGEPVGTSRAGESGDGRTQRIWKSSEGDVTVTAGAYVAADLTVRALDLRSTDERFALVRGVPASLTGANPVDLMWEVGSCAYTLTVPTDLAAARAYASRF